MTEVPVGVSCPLNTHKLVVDCEVLPISEFLIVLLHHFPSFVLPIQDLQSFSLQLGLPSFLFLVSPLAFILGKVLLEALEGYITQNVPSM